jgi:hypothetical protein
MTSGDIALRQPRGNAIPDTAAPSVFIGNWCSLILGGRRCKAAPARTQSRLRYRDLLAHYSLHSIWGRT